MITSTFILRDMPADEYHASPAVSNSMLSALHKSPRHCWAQYIDPNRPERVPTDAMRAGTLAHTLILEPAVALDRYVVKPAGLDGRTKEGRAWCQEAAGREIVSADAWTCAESQKRALMAVPELAYALSSGEGEVSVFWRDERTGLQCRARIDWLHRLPDRRYLVLDVKTVADVMPEGFARAISTYGHHRQAAHYTNGLRANGIDVAGFVFAAVSSAHPWIAAPYVLDPETEAQGQEEVAELLELFAECQRSGAWDAFGPGYQVTGLPVWARRSNQVEVSYAD